MVLLPAQMATGLYAVLGLSGLCRLEFKKMKAATVAHVRWPSLQRPIEKGCELRS